MNKIAVCFNGQLRTAESASSNLIKYFGEYFNNIDFFIHTWTHNSVRVPFNINLEPEADVKVDNIEIEKIISLYHPINYIIENSEVYYRRIQEKYGSTGDLVNFWHSFYYSNTLKKVYEKLNNFKYDVVVRLRPDAIFPPDRFFVNDLKEFYEDKNSFYLQERFGDALQISNSVNMDIAADFYGNRTFYGQHFWPMDLFKSYINDQKIKINQLRDNRITILRQKYKYLDPIQYYYHHNIINSLEYENINYAKEYHHLTYENLNDPDWRIKAKESITEIFSGDTETTFKYFDIFKEEK